MDTATEFAIAAGLVLPFVGGIVVVAGVAGILARIGSRFFDISTDYVERWDHESSSSTHTEVDQ